MTDTQKFFISFIEIFPENSIMSLDTSDDELLKIIVKMKDSSIVNNYTAKFQLTKENKNIILRNAINNHLEERIHRLRVFLNSEQLFVAYDGCEVGIISRKVNITSKFVSEFIDTGVCGIVDEVPEA